MSEAADVAVRPSLLKPAHWPMFLALGVMVIVARLPWTLQRALGRGVGWIALRTAGTRRR
ncbi:lipid A biosynthesis lauroyl acyltransferase, partial [Xanthomonas sp. Kuri4-2]